MDINGYNYWNFLCKIKNYYNGSTKSSEDNIKELNGRLEWFNNYFNLFQNDKYFKDAKHPLPALIRGNIVLVELGFNIGMEFGGRHYCIVLKDSSLNSKRVFVLPITTQKPSDYNIMKNTLYIQFNKIQGLNAKKDKGNPNGHKRWVNILNIRTISKSRIIYPVDRGIPNLTQGQMREISLRIVSQIAMRRDLLQTEKKYKKLVKQHNDLQNQYNNLKRNYDSIVSKK